MPTPPRTSLETIVRAARRILETEGLEQLTMQAVANAVGVRAPSLYKHVRDRADLIHCVANNATLELASRLDEAATSRAPGRDLRALAEAHRAFAISNPQAYRLLFSDLPESWRADAEISALAVRPLFRAVTGLTGDEQALEAARTIVAWSHGFVSMELAGAFRMGGDVDAAFDYGIGRLTTAIES